MNPIHFLLDSASELSWEAPDEISEMLSPMLEEEEEENVNKEEEEDDEDLPNIVSSSSNLQSMAPISSISEVTLADRRSMVSIDNDVFMCKLIRKLILTKQQLHGFCRNQFLLSAYDQMLLHNQHSFFINRPSIT